MRTQLEKDLMLRIKDKHMQWFDDSVDLFEMAGFSNDQALAHVSTELVMRAATLLSILETSTTENIIESFAHTIQAIRNSKETNQNDE